MQASSNKLVSQPFIGIVAFAIGVAAIAGAWVGMQHHAADPHGTPILILTACLVASIIPSRRFPIAIRPHTKIVMGTVPLYLMVALLPPPLAVTGVGLAKLLGEFMAKGERKLFLSDIATDAGRWMIIAFPAALVAHLTAQNDSFHSLSLIGAAAILWAGDIITSPLLIGPATGERAFKIVSSVGRGAGPVEAAQYLVGLLGALVAVQQYWGLALLVLPTAVVYMAFKSARDMHDSTLHILESTAETMHIFDLYRGGHSRRVTEVTRNILREMKIRGSEAERIISAARVHDIGMIAVPEHVLMKNGPLTDEERALVQKHAELGANILRKHPDFEDAVDMIQHHHERWDGAGYPHQLKATEIPLGARIIAVADSYSAMTSDRPYREALSSREAAAIINAGSARQWDPQVVEAFMRSIAKELEAGAQVWTPALGPAAQAQ